MGEMQRPYGALTARRAWWVFWWSVAGTGSAFFIGLVAVIMAGLGEADWLGYIALTAWAVPVLLGIVAAVLSVVPVLPLGKVRRHTLELTLSAAAVISTIPWIVFAYFAVADRSGSWGEDLFLLFFVPFVVSPAICFLVATRNVRRNGYSIPIAPLSRVRGSFGASNVGLSAVPSREVLRMTAFVGASVWEALLRAEKEEPPAESLARGVASILGQPSAPDMSTGVDVVIAEEGLAIHRSENEWHRMLFGNLPFPDLKFRWTDISSVEKVRGGNRLKFAIAASPVPVFNLSTLSHKTLERLMDALESHGVMVIGHGSVKVPLSGRIAS